MKLLTTKIALFVLLFSLGMSSSVVQAQARGGSCRGGFCELSGSIIGLLLFGAFLISVAQSIHRHGFWSGLIRHSGVQFMVMYVGMIGGMVFIFVGADKLWGKDGAIFAMLALMFVLWRVGQRDIQKPSNSEDENA